MFKQFSNGFALLLLSAGSAQAANCSPYIYNLTNGTTADANQVMGNFNNVLSCANTSLAPIANPSFTGSLGVDGNNANQIAIVSENDNGAPASGVPVAYITLLQAGSSAFGIGGWPNAGVLESAGAGGLVLDSYESGIQFQTTRTTRMSLTPTGALGIGTATPSYSLQVNGSAGGGGAWITISDARLKKNVVEVTDALSLITRLRAVRYDWRLAGEREVGKDLNLPTDEKQIGFLAQEVEAVLPEAVAAPKATDNASAPDSSALYGLKEANLIPLLVQAAKEQQAEIEQLRTTLAALKSGQ